MIQEIEKNYNFKDIESEIINYWDINDIYKKTKELKKEKKPFFFVDGPPYTTGNIHLGTAWNKIMKDSILRYLSMNEYNTIDTPGWDMHGLPIEVKVEEKLGFHSKKDIESFGVSNFIFECKKFALENQKSMTEQFKKLGIWMNWDNPYMTLTNEYIESAWWITKKIYENNLLTSGKRVVNWCPRCETAIADSEVEYNEKEDKSIYVKFEIKDQKDTYIIIWTTTPWTLPSNVGIAVHPDYEYIKVKVHKLGYENEVEYLYILKEKIDFILKIGNYSSNYEIINSYKGKDLENIEYIFPLKENILNIENRYSRKIVLADYVEKENTGCVHISPGHGMDDYHVGTRYQMPIICLVNSNGTFNDIAESYNGLNIYDANEKIIEELKNMKSLVALKNITHRCGHCWRCKTPIIYRATEQWFVEISKLRNELLEQITEINWYPEWAGSSRFKDWIKEARDWCISRQRYWGIPIPIWICNKCQNIDVIGTKEELISKSHCSDSIDLHRQDVDLILLKCSKCKGNMKRINDIFDVWFDSAMASFATLKYPEEKNQFNQMWPADLILEGHDQTRGWFYSQLGASIASLRKKPYKNVLMHGFTLDSNGRKMSKSIGNVISPIDVIDKFGTDVLRLYILSANAPWDDLKYNEDEIKNIYRIINILWNVYKFPLPYMILDKYNPLDYNIEDLVQFMKYEDKWILSKLQTVIIDITTYMKDYKLHKILRLLYSFILDDLSRWYIQLIRERTWVEKNTVDKTVVYSCLYYIYYTLIKLLAPFAPYITEKLYLSLFKNLNNFDSIHMNKWPKVISKFVDNELEEMMEIIRNIVEMVSNARQKIGRKLRWPIKQIIIITKDKLVLKSINNLKFVLLDQINSKEINVLMNNNYWDESFIKIKPLQNKLGPLFKENSNIVYKYLLNLNAMDLLNKFDKSEKIKININSELVIDISKDMFQFEEYTPEDTILLNTDFGKIYVDCRLNDDLKSEGLAREIIRRIQDMRKELKLDLNDLIDVDIYSNNNDMIKLLDTKKQLIGKEVRSSSCIVKTNNKDKENNKIKNLKLTKIWDIDSEKIEIRVYI